jgi:SNF2 family DNA or RNA helicase
MEIISENSRLISTNYIRIISENNIYPTNIELFSIIPDISVTFKYNIDNNINYINYLYNNKTEQHILYEILNKSLLWNIKYDIVKLDETIFNIELSIILNTDYINVYIDSSLAFNYYLYDLFYNIPNYSDCNKSIIPNYNIIYQHPDFKIKLFNYQNNSLTKMINIERKISNMKINYEYNFNLNNKYILYDPVMNKKSDNRLELILNSKGGVLADEMGLGKTISAIALINYNPAPNNIPSIKDNKINTKATLIICPSHLVKQWETEIIKCNPKLKILLIISKSTHSNLKFIDFINADIIITSQQFIINFTYYPTLYYHNEISISRINYLHRYDFLMRFLQIKIDNENIATIHNMDAPLFEFFNFHRLILDEAHEIFAEMMNSNSINKYISNWIYNITSDYRWYISGTPFINLAAIKNCAKFLDLKLYDENRNLSYVYNKETLLSNKLLTPFINKKYLWDNILDKICIRHKYSDIEYQVKLLGFEETIYWLKLTNLESQLYNSKKNKATSTYLQQLCCHPLIIESSKKIYGEIEVDLSLMQDKLIEYHKNNYENYKTKLENLDNTRHEYYMLKKTFETQINESKYLFTILENMKSNSNILEDENCSICMDDLVNPTITKCGHIYCYECIRLCLSNKKLCPLCKKELNLKDLIIINSKKDDNNNDILITKYGSKLGKLISIIMELNKNDKTRIIIFSQWDDMLTLIGKTLTDNKINNNFIKGNVWSRNNSINKSYSNLYRSA